MLAATKRNIQKHTRNKITIGCATFFILLACFCPQALSQQPRFEYLPAPIDNPLKGLVPYSGEKRKLFPHSMEFSYLPLSDLMSDWNEFDWQPLEKLLDDIASRGHQTVFRIWMVYPGHDDGIPKFLEREGVQVTEWLNTNTQPFPPSKVRTPDYDDPRTRRALVQFITAMGKKYDGDPRIGFITAGLLGTWGEWHEYPRDDLFANKETQMIVLDAFEKAFQKTPILLRYPAGENHWNLSSNHTRNFGYHDDSFAWATLDTGRKEDNWFFMPAMKAAGMPAMEKWKTEPIGGEIRPELWGKIFDDKVEITEAQDFAKCVQTTHVSWLMDTGMFGQRQSDNRIANATKQVEKMGYEFFVTRASLSNVSGNQITLEIQVENRGVAPFYYPWQVEIAAMDVSGEVVHRWPTSFSLTDLLPKQPTRSWNQTIDVTTIPKNTTSLAIRVINPMPGGLPLHFANAGRMENGWLIVANVSDLP